MGRTSGGVWDFVSDTLSNGRRFRCLTIMDEFSRECMAIHVAHSIPATGVIEVVERLKQSRGLPEVIITDQRLRVPQPCLRFMGLRSGCEAGLHPAGQTGPERIHRELQRNTQKRVLESALVPLDPGRETLDRAMEKLTTTSSSPQLLGFSDSRGVHGYSFTERGGSRS